MYNRKNCLLFLLVFNFSYCFSFLSDERTTGVSIGYQGCIRKLSINNKELNLRYPGPTVKRQKNVLPSCTVSPCAKKPCLNGATCIATSARSYQCRCLLGYRGSRCENKSEFTICYFGFLWPIHRIWV